MGTWPDESRFTDSADERLKGIIDARNASIQADSGHAIEACLNHNLAGRGHEQFPVGASLQIAVGKQWAGTLRAIAHSAGDLLVGRGNKILKRRKCKTRLVHLGNRDEMGRIHIPANARVWAKRRRRLADARPEESHPPNTELAGEEVEVPETVDVRDSPIPDGELVEIGQQIPDSPERGDDPVEIGVMFDGRHYGRVFPESTYVHHGVATCENTTAVAPGGHGPVLLSLLRHLANVTERIQLRESRRAIKI